MGQTKLAIRKLITRTGLTVSEISSRINASEKSIYKWINGTTKPNCDHLLALFELIEELEGKH